ncbi:MAG: HD domain-containing protein [Candidatus Thorarchaeota archaeon]
MSDVYSWAGPEGRFGAPVWRLNRILALIQSKIQKLIEEEREIPLSWSIQHLYSTSQLAKLLALKRGLDVELAGLACAFHDIYSVLTGLYEDHGPNAAPYVREIVGEYNEESSGDFPEISDDEIQQIVMAIAGHSDKTSVSADPLAELVKDVDTIDAYLHGMTTTAADGRLQRANKVFQELGINL